jgi:GNAT superfamily N-acetyltransferase
MSTPTPNKPSLRLGELRDQDRTAWEPLARGYKTFYETVVDDAGHEATWRRLRAGGLLLGLGAWLPATDGPGERLVGIAHAVYQRSPWADEEVCYLQDLFTDDTVRGQGVAGALIAHLAQCAQARGASRYYWLTHHTNARARRLYDRVAVNRGFIRYDHPLPV